MAQLLISRSIGQIFVAGEPCASRCVFSRPDWLEDIDGIEFETDGTIQVIPVGGQLIRLRSEGDVEIHSAERLSGTHHSYAPQLGLALVPTGFDTTIGALRVAGGADYDRVRRHKAVEEIK